MASFQKAQIAATIYYMVQLVSTEGLEQLLRNGKPSRCAIEDLHMVLAEHGQRITLPAKLPKPYLTHGEGTPAELYADIRLWVDEAPSDLVLRCTLFAEQHAGHYAYRVEDLLAP